MKLWHLPEIAVIGDVEYRMNTDYRDIFEIMAYLNDEDTPIWLRWQIAIGLFYEEEVPEEHHQEAMEYLADFLVCGEHDDKPAPKLLDWEQDAQVIAADINKAAGVEIRAVPYLHWWTFLSYFHAIGEGQLSTLISLREKLRTGKKLEKWEREYYLKNKSRVDLKKRYSAEELAEQERLKTLLGE